jgi:transcriptional regulator of acetoin/glycerol metabolism
MSATPVVDVDDICIPISNTDSESIELEDFNSAKKRIVCSFTKNYLTQLLTEEGGNVASAAKRAGKSRTGFWNLLKKFNISPEKFH